MSHLAEDCPSLDTLISQAKSLYNETFGHVWTLTVLLDLSIYPFLNPSLSFGLFILLGVVGFQVPYHAPLAFPVAS